MEVEKIAIADLVPADYNPRKITKEEQMKLRNSIDQFGFVDPIIINLKNNKIIGGHQRYEVLVNTAMLDGEFLKELNLIRLGDIGWVFPDTDLSVKSEEHEKALNLALNKISGEWDTEKLSDLLEDLSIEGFNLDLTGFDDAEIEEINPDIFLDDFEDALNEQEKESESVDIGNLIYQPHEEDHEISDLYETEDRFDEMIENCQNEELKKLLEIRKAWFCRFHFDKIADWYAYQATPEEQEIIEAMGMVILDKDKMLEHGYLELINELEE